MAVEPQAKTVVVQFEPPYAKRCLIELLSLISLRVDCRQKIERGQGGESEGEAIADILAAIRERCR